MKIGLLWYDDDPRKPSEQKIAQALERYKEKFGLAPDTCYVPAGVQVTAEALSGLISRNGGHDNASMPRLRVVPSRAVRPNHFWIGVDDAVGPEAGAPGSNPAPRPPAPKGLRR
jgi:hypothetical protein